MGVRKLKAITPGQRFRVVNDYDGITATSPEKSLTRPKKRSGGRNNTGKMTMRYLGGGSKQRYRTIDFKREKFGIPASVKSIEYDPNRSAFIALVVYADGEKRYIIAPDGLQIGQKIGESIDSTELKTLLAILLGLGFLVEAIPLACLAAILFKVGIDILDYRILPVVKKLPLTDLFVFIIVLSV